MPEERSAAVIRQTKEIRDLITRNPDLPIVVASDVRLPDDILNLYCLPDVRCRVAWVLDYDYLGNGTLITDPKHLDLCLEDDLAEKYGNDKDAFVMAFYAEKGRLNPYWRKVLLIER